MVRMQCILTDCVYFKEFPDKPGVTFCAHKDIMLHLSNSTCPLYRMDWAKKMAKAQKLVIRLKNKTNNT